MTQSDIHTSTASGSSKPTDARKGKPIFVLGIMPRSGTNFLHRLICQHPDCGAINTTPVREDYMVHHAHRLHGYLRKLRWQWGHWGADENFVAPLFQQVGEGLSNFLDSLTDARRLVTKTPSVSNLSLFFEYFPHAHLLIIVRDGRSVVASGMSGFGWNFETATRQWAGAAREIMTFLEANASYVDRYRVVRYESLNEQTTEELEQILDFLGLDPDLYDFDAALDTPVYGSSFMKEGQGQVTWEPKARNDRFNTNTRWLSWSTFDHLRFNHLAGRELRALGYDPLELDAGIFASGLQVFLDGAYSARRFPRKMAGAMKAGMKAFRDQFDDQSHTKVNLKR